jgi:hypothetical protein
MIGVSVDDMQVRAWVSKVDEWYFRKRVFQVLNRMRAKVDISYVPEVDRRWSIVFAWQERGRSILVSDVSEDMFGILHIASSVLNRTSSWWGEVISGRRENGLSGVWM